MWALRMPTADAAQQPSPPPPHRRPSWRWPAASSPWPPPPPPPPLRGWLCSHRVRVIPDLANGGQLGIRLVHSRVQFPRQNSNLTQLFGRTRLVGRQPAFAGRRWRERSSPPGQKKAPMQPPESPASQWRACVEGAGPRRCHPCTRLQWCIPPRFEAAAAQVRPDAESHPTSSSRRRTAIAPSNRASSSPFSSVSGGTAMHKPRRAPAPRLRTP